MNSSLSRDGSSSASESAPTLSAGESGPGREKNLSTRLFYDMCLVVLLVVSAAASFSAFYEKWHFREAGGRGFDPVATFDQMIDGTAYRPYIYRQLLPDVANWLTRALPTEALSRVIPERAKMKISVAFNLTTKKYPVQYLIIYIADYLSALFAAFALYRVGTTVISQPAALFATVVFMLLFPLIGIKGGMLYDYPELFFIALAAWMALELDWWWLIPIAALGTWNKESFLLFMFTLYPFFRLRSSRLKSLIGVFVLVAVCAAVYLPIRYHFAHNLGGGVEWHVKDKIDYYLHPFQVDVWVDRTYDLMFPALSAPIPFILLIWTVWRSWHLLPLWLKRHAQIAAVINIPLYILFCAAGELRDFSLLFITFLLMMGFSLQEWMESAKAKTLHASAPIPTA